jgi:hypothetical protein
MLSCSHLEFRLMPYDAQRAAVHRLALHGWDSKTISTMTGITEADVHRYLTGAWPLDERAYPPLKWKNRREALLSVQPHARSLSS